MKAEAGFAGLNPSHDAGHMARAVMEGVACQAAWMLETFGPAAESALILTGGASRSPLWTQMIADIAARPLTLSAIPEAGCLGAAALAGAAAGLFPSPECGAAALAGARRRVDPGPDAPALRTRCWPGTNPARIGWRPVRRDPMALFDLTPADRRVYDAQLRDFLPPEIFDIHSHLWLESFWSAPKAPTCARSAGRTSWRGTTVGRISRELPLAVPLKRVVPMVFANPEPPDDISAHNGYVRSGAEALGCPALYFSHPAQSAREVEAGRAGGGLSGPQELSNLSPAHIPEPDIRITDFFPAPQLEVLNRRGWFMMLHIPAPDGCGTRQTFRTSPGSSAPTAASG